MALSTQPYKGTRDFYPEDMRIQRYMFEKMRKLALSFGYEEYDGPMLEPFELYAAKTGEEIVNQQLYWLIDRGERKLAIRPEMTPTLARMVAGKIHELPKPIRWFSIPNLWRYERPQRGRLREHWQLNVDVLGGDAVLADSEILSLSFELMKSFGGEAFVSIHVNNRRLMDHFFEKELGLDLGPALQITKAIDARAKIGEEAFSKSLATLGLSQTQIGKLDTFFKSSFDEIEKSMPSDGVNELRRLFQYLGESGIEKQVKFDQSVMRGMDYYTGTVFEMFDHSPDNRRAMFGGGRYDNLVGLFGNHKLSGVGFGMGDVTLRNFLETHQLLPKFENNIDIFVSLPSLELRSQAEDLTRKLREKGLKVVTPLSVDGFGPSLKLAHKLGARFAILFGEIELKEGKVLLKDLKLNSQTAELLSELPETVARALSVHES